jgi:hypothetical protein
MTSENKHNYKLVIPTNLNIKELATEKRYLVYGRRRRVIDGVTKQVWIEDWFDSKKLLKHEDYCYALIDILIYVNETRYNDGDRTVFSNLKQEYLMDSIPKSTLHIVTSFLRALGVIECDDLFVPSHMRKKTNGKLEKAKCYGYRLTEDYRGDTKVITSTTRVTLKKKKSAERRTFAELAKNGNKTFRNQVEWIQEGYYTVKDKNQVVEYIQGLLNTRDSKGRVITPSRIANMIKEVEHISFGSLDGIRIDPWGRFHSLVSRMSKEARSFISGIDGQPLVQLDFKSSYTFHLLHLIRKEKGYIGAIKNCPYNTYQHQGTLLEKELEFLYDKCMDHDIYRFIAHEYKKSFAPLDPDNSKARDIVKDCWNHSFLSSESPKHPMLFKFIIEMFPQINSFIAKRGRYTLWIALMRSEANLVHHQIISRISKEIGLDCTLFSIHDALLIDRTNAATILGIMEEESELFFGFPVRIKSEQLENPLHHEVALLTK